MSVPPGTMPLASRLAAERFGPGHVVIGTGYPFDARVRESTLALLAGDG
jgi:hypothetical protein